MLADEAVSGHAPRAVRRRALGLAGELDHELETLVGLVARPDSLYPAHVRRLDLGSVRAERAQLVADICWYFTELCWEEALWCGSSALGGIVTRSAQPAADLGGKHLGGKRRRRRFAAPRYGDAGLVASLVQPDSHLPEDRRRRRVGLRATRGRWRYPDAAVRSSFVLAAVALCAVAGCGRGSDADSQSATPRSGVALMGTGG